MGKFNWGYAFGPRIILSAREVGASEVFKSQSSGCFVKVDTSKRLEVAGSGDAVLVGWVLIGGSSVTASTTEGRTTLPLDISPWSCYWIPADATVTAPGSTSSQLYETCDLITTSDVQYADIGESTEDVIRIIDIDVTNTAVLVHMNPTKMFATGVV